MNPAQSAGALAAAFERIAGTRMAGLAMNNPALRVATVGFRPWQEKLLVGVLITPWAINLVLLGDGSVGDLQLAADCRRTWSFPSGRYEFMGGDEPECGAFQFCSLWSPAFEFRDHAAAEAMAHEILAALFVGEAGSAAGAARESARLRGAPVLRAPTSRRGFLQGMLGGIGA
jgi:[NiFe] hydrogenase assembly HybE family chaperone